MRTTPMRPTLLRLSAAVLAVLTASACGATAKPDTTATNSADAGKPVAGLRLMVPNSPGGGYDTTARIGAKVMEESKIASGIEGIGPIAATVLGATGQVPYCLPPITIPTLPGRDGGVRTTTTITGIDGGVVDAGR